MSQITATLGGVTLPLFTIPFIRRNLENAADITTLNQTIYTDFVSYKDEWELNFEVMDEDTYNLFLDVYHLQFTSGNYPLFVLPYYDIEAFVRFYINEQDIRFDGACMRGVQFTLIAMAPVS